MHMIPRIIRNSICVSHSVNKRIQITIKKPTIYLTFDDGPHPRYTMEVLALLESYNAAKATFFVNSNLLVQSDAVDVCRNIIEQGHTLGNHTHSHALLPDCSWGTFEDEVEQCQTAIDKLQNQQNDSWRNHQSSARTKKLFRPPRGLLNLFQTLWLIKNSYRIFLWSVDSGDSFGLEPGVITERLKRIVSSGDIVLFHDDKQLSCKVLAEMLPFWTKLYELKSLDQ